jgi:hypothetical protein
MDNQMIVTSVYEVAKRTLFEPDVNVTLPLIYVKTIDSDDPGSLTKRQPEEDSHDRGLAGENADRHCTPTQIATPVVRESTTLSPYRL